MPKSSPSSVLICAGLDPCGGAGLIADVQTCTLLGSHPMAVMTANTVQNTVNASQFLPVTAYWLQQQLGALETDITPDIVKIGMIGSAEIANALGQWLCKQKIPVVFDPILKAGGGGCLADEALIDAIHQQILPLTWLCTPNLPELKTLANQDNELDAIRTLSQAGCENILVTGGHDEGQENTNRLYHHGNLIGTWPWKKMPGEYRGTGCTLATAISCCCAKGASLVDACQQAQDFVTASVKSAYSLGKGQQILNRLQAPIYNDE